MVEDIWSKWLKHRRFGGDINFQKVALEQFQKLASKIVDRAEIFDSATVLDVGAGDGIVGISALSKLGNNGKLIFSDISEAALSIPKKIFQNKKNLDTRIEFFVNGIEDLCHISNESIDRVLLRSVLLYVKDKQRAFNEIYRVLRPKGIAVIMEPINQRHVEFSQGYFRGYNLDYEPIASIKPLIQKVKAYLKKHTQDSMLGYNEHNLVNFSINSGFEEVKLEYELNRTSKARFSSFKAFFDSAPNPQAETLRETLNVVLSKRDVNKVKKILEQIVTQPAVLITSQAILILKK